MTVGEIERRMSDRELRDWYRFEGLQPLPDRLADLHVAMLASIMVNLARAADAQPVALTDFLIIRERMLSPPDDGEAEIDRHMRNWRGG